MPGRQSVGKLPPSLLRDDVGRGIKAVINYAITRFYLKIKTVFFASMRLTDSHIALTSSCFLLLHSLISFVFFRSIFHSSRFSSGKSFGFCWLRRMRVSIFSPTRPTSPPLSLPSLLRFLRYLIDRVFLSVFLLHSFSRASLI